MFFYPLENSIDAGGTMQIGPSLGNSRPGVIRSFQSPKQKKPRISRGFLPCWCR
jgi:hypothetical protein